MTKCALKRGQGIHNYDTRGIENYRTGRHSTVIFNTSLTNGCNTRLNRCLAMLASFWHIAGRPSVWLTDIGAGSGNWKMVESNECTTFLIWTTFAVIPVDETSRDQLERRDCILQSKEEDL
ncbi:hypothetical protein J6590_067767 [Homalodisca vitripennis]|nr:hypothetical protein J6590_067767 [Homalodisca vitripennis]